MTGRASMWLMLGAGFFLAAAIYWTLSGTPEPKPVAQASVSSGEDPGSLTRQPHRRAGDILVARPLFTAGRRLVTPMDTAPEAEIDDLVLRGVMVAGNGGSAMLEVQGTRRFHTVRQGEKIGGWRLAEVHADEVVFEKSGDRRTLSLPFTPEGAAE